MNWNPSERILIKITSKRSDGYIIHSTARANQGDVASAEADLNRPYFCPRRKVLPGTLHAWSFYAVIKTEAAGPRHDSAVPSGPHRYTRPRFTPGHEALGKHRLRAWPRLPLAVKRLQEQFEKSALRRRSRVSYLGQAQARNSKQADAEQSFSKAVELAPSNAAAILALAGVQAARAETDAAIASYKRAIPLASDERAKSLSRLALYTRPRGDWQQAQTTYAARLFSIQGDNAFAANNLAYPAPRTRW